MSAVIFFDTFVGVPGFFEMSAAGVKLDEANAAFHESACNETVAAKFVGRLLADTIEVESRLRFLGDINRFRSGGLHAPGKFVRADAGGEVITIGTAVEVLLVELLEQINLLALDGWGDMAGTAEIRNRGTNRPKECSLISSR